MGNSVNAVLCHWAQLLNIARRHIHGLGAEIKKQQQVYWFGSGSKNSNGNFNFAGGLLYVLAGILMS